MTTRKWLLRIAKLSVITWLVSNTGFFTLLKQTATTPNPAHQAYEHVRDNRGLKGIIKEEQLFNQYVQTKIDSVAALVETGSVYGIRDYFLDLKDIYAYDDRNAGWMKGSIEISHLQDYISKSGSRPSFDETDLARCEILGDCQTSSPFDWSSVGHWFLEQYILGLLPALLLCLILGFQGRIAFNLKRAPISALAYLALWPISFFVLIRRSLQSVDREARMRMSKESLFSKLSGLEEEFLHRLASGLAGGEEKAKLAIGGVERLQFRYVLALFAVVMIRIAPSVASVPTTNDDLPKDTVECQMSIQDESQEDGKWHPVNVCVLGTTENKPHACEDMHWPKLFVSELVGFKRSIEYVPLSVAILRVCVNTQNNQHENITRHRMPLGVIAWQSSDNGHFSRSRFKLRTGTHLRRCSWGQ